MKKITKEMIENIVMKSTEKASKYASELLLENMETCTSTSKEIGNINCRNILCNTMIPISTAYQLSMIAMTHVLCELLFDEISE